jgi:hypothetical protein
LAYVLKQSMPAGSGLKVIDDAFSNEPGDNRRICEFGHEHSGADRQEVERQGSRCIAKSHLFPKHWSCSMTFTTHIVYRVEADGTMERRGPATVSD